MFHFSRNSTQENESFARNPGIPPIDRAVPADLETCVKSGADVCPVSIIHVE